MNPWIIVFIAVATVLGVIFGFGYYAYRVAFYNNPKKRPPDPYRHVKNDGSRESEFSKRLIDEMIARPSRNVYITSRDGLKLRARLYMQNENAPFVLAMHGYRSTPMLDFSGGGALALKLGFNVIMPDERACGESEGRTISFGYNESLDTLDWINYINGRWGKNREIVLIGVSLGAGTVIMAAGRGLPENVKGVIADSTFSSAKKIVMKVMKDRGFPTFLYPILRLGTIIYGGFDPNKADAAAFASKIKVPLLLVHGEDDGFVPPEMSREIYEATDMAQLHTFPMAHHGTSYIVDTERYEKTTVDFLKSVIKDNAELNF
ncbi:MAG: alpha/beta hydrolase [Ruminococcaceae bacterium]|nr:alpha/beta hydrolase [Oscillospiraceae bacterium]